jgi:hypothetical protein
LDYRVYLFFYNKKTAEAVSLFIGGAKRDRTADPLRARQVLSQLSYGPNFYKWSGRQDLNLRPPGPKPGALPSCATSRYCPYNYTYIFTLIKLYFKKILK